MENKLSIAFAASEAVPYAKTGGLGDVVGALTRALAELGHSVVLILPMYREVKKLSQELSSTRLSVKVSISGKLIEGEIFQAKPHKNLTVYFVKNDRYFDRDGLYGNNDGDFGDNAERFIFFSRAVPRVLEKVHFSPDIVHSHDWQTGLIPALFYFEEKGNKFFEKTKTLFTIHNVAFQGNFWHLDMHLTGLPWSAFTPDGLEFYGKISFLKAGIVYADAVSTVSKKYAEEIQTADFAYGFEGILRSRSKDLFGILNGVDYQEWNPKTDRFLAQNYDSRDLSGKRECKRALIREFGLQIDENAPLFGMVSRLTEQKGIDLILGAIDEIAGRGGALIVLGVGDPHYQFWLEETQKRTSALRLRLAFDNAMAHRIEAGADFYLMPSKYEPCGLNQLYSLKYGTPPIVRATGGLDDSVQEFNPSTLQGNGFKFGSFETWAFVEEIRRALSVYQNENLWRAVVKNAMLCDYSWEHAAKEYKSRYKELADVRTAQRSGSGAVGNHRHRTRKTPQRF